MRMSTIVLCLVMTGCLALVCWASSIGLGVPQPTKEPLSIREDSARGTLQRGHHRTRYFVGGGIFHGK
ncbi:MAG: hypothetical protein KKB50_04175 [Planctomycetes bacterium]|nr:hypothetical protein [Planctomycetota bacterium]